MPRLIPLIAALGLGLLTTSACAAGTASPRLVLIDQDAFGPATSNLQSVLMAIQAPDVRVLGITIESGDGWCRENTQHTLRMLELIGRPDIPVAAGPDLPLLNTPAATRLWEARYGKLAYKGAWTEAWPKNSVVPRSPPHAADVVPPLVEGEPRIKALAESAAEFLVHTVRAHPHQVSIVALGPLTNLALAAKLDPEFPALTKELVIMGGSFAPQPPPGGSAFASEYANTPRLEFNFRFDPEAASIVLHQPWPHLTLVPVDPTTTTYLGQATLDQIGTAPGVVAQYVHRYGQAGYPLWDEMAMGLWLKPGLITQHRTLAVDVDIDHGAGYGNTLSWNPGQGPGLGEQQADVVFKVDDRALLEQFKQLMQASTPRP
ncbi:nucleoside hydrolase [Frateuria aurantia]